MVQLFLDSWYFSNLFGVEVNLEKSPKNGTSYVLRHLEEGAFGAVPTLKSIQ